MTFNYFIRITGLLLLVVLQACSSTLEEREEKGKPFPLPEFESKVKPKVVWKRNIGNGQGRHYNRLSLAIDGDLICAAAINGDVNCYNTEGKKHWSVDVNSEILGGVGLVDDLVLVVSGDGELIALERDTGEERWRKSLNREVLAAPVGDDGVIVIQNSEGLVFALDTEGNELWDYLSDEPLLTLRGTATPVVDSGMVYTGFANGKVVALTLEKGVPVWDQFVAIAKGTAEIGRIVDVDASPMLLQDSVYAASFNGNLFRFMRNNGRPLWRTEVSTYRALSNGFGNVYAVDEKSRVLAVNTERGEQSWENGLLLNRGLSAPQVYGGYLFAVDEEGYLHVFSQVNGELIGRLNIGGDGVRVPMISDSDNLYLYTNNGDLVAITLRDNIRRSSSALRNRSLRR